VIEAGYPSAKVDEVFKGIPEVPKNLEELFFGMLKENLKERIAEDVDFKEKKEKGSKQLDALNKI